MFAHRRLYYLLTGILIPFFFIPAFGQSVTPVRSELDFFGAQYSYLPQPVFASYGGNKSIFESTLNYTGFTGIRKNQKTIRAAADYTLFSSRDQDMNSSIGLVLSAQYSGPYISRNRIYAHYETNIPLNRSIIGSAGIHAGLFNLNLKDNPTGVSGSAMTPDGNISVGFCDRERQWALYGHMHQFFGNSFESGFINGKLDRYYSVRAYYKLLNKNNLTIRTGTWYRTFSFQPNELYIDLTGSYKKLELGIVYVSYQQIIPMIKLIEIGRQNNWNIAFSTHIDLLINPLSRLGTFELGINYLVKGSLLELNNTSTK